VAQFVSHPSLNKTMALKSFNQNHQEKLEIKSEIILLIRTSLAIQYY